MQSKQLVYMQNPNLTGKEYGKLKGIRIFTKSVKNERGR